MHSSIKLYANQLRRDKVILVFFSGIILYIIFGFIMSFETRDVINLVYKSQYTHLLSMLFFLVIGVKLGSIEKSHRCIEFFDTIDKARKAHTYAKFTVGLFIVFANYITFVILFCIFWLLSGSTKAVLIHINSYILLRMLIPYITCIILSISIGEQLPKRYSYVVVFIIWLLISPISSIVTQFIFTAFNLNSQFLWYVFNVLNMGGRIINTLASPYGLNQGSPIWIANGCLLVVVSLYSLLVCAGTPSIKRKFSLSVLLVASILIGVFSAGTKEVQLYFNMYDAYSIYRTEYDTEYYGKYYSMSSELLGKTLNLEMLPNYDHESSGKPLAYNILLAPHTIDMSVNCNIILKMLKSTQSQSFTLYHGFAVYEVLVDGIEADFQQSGDYLNIKLPREHKKDDTICLTINYRGVSSAIYPGNSEMISLPSSFPWIPRPGMVLPPDKSLYTMSDSLVMFDPWSTEEPVKFRLSLDTKDKVYVNIPMVSTGLWEGETSSGISVASSRLLAIKKLDDYTIYYPQTVSQYLPDIIIATEKIIKYREKIFELINIKSTKKLSKNIVLFPSNPDEPNAQHELHIINNDPLLYFNSINNIYIYLYKYGDLADEASLAAAYNSVISTSDFLRAGDKEPISMFIASECWRQWCSSQIQKTEIVFKPDYKSIYEMYYGATGSLYSTSIQQVKTFTEGLSAIINNRDSAAAKEFFSWWYEQCKNHSYPNMNDYLGKVDSILAEGDKTHE